MGNIARGLVKGVPVTFEGGTGVDIKRGTVLLGKLLQRGLLGLKLAVGIVVKVIQGGGSFLEWVRHYCGAASLVAAGVAGCAACGVLWLWGCSGGGI